MSEKIFLPVLQSPHPAGGGGAPGWEAVFEAIEDGICVQSFDSRIVLANGPFAALIGLPLERIIGRPCHDIFGCASETGALPHFCARAASSETGRPATEELVLPQTGQRLRTRVSPVRDGAGKAIAHVMVVRDVTEIAARERAQSRVEQLARFGELAAGLAHEIKNPLAGIQGAVDILLQRRSASDPEREVLEGVRGEVQRIDALVRALLDRARPRGFDFRHASVTDSVRRAVSLARHHAASVKAKRGHRIEVEFIGDSSPIVMAIDSAQIEDAVLNLVANAIEAIDGHGSVSVRLHEHGGKDADSEEVVIEVKDTGRGIAEEDLKRIFSPFFTTHPEGTGLGLPAVKRIARAHGGRVEVESSPGQGSTFTIRLPREPR